MVLRDITIVFLQNFPLFARAVKVYAEIRGSMYEEQNQRIYMQKGETKELLFVFDVGFLDSVFTTENCKA